MSVKYLLVAILLSMFVSISNTQPSFAGASDARAIVDGKSWRFRSEYKGSRGFAGTFKFSKDNVLRMHSRSFSLRGTYRIRGNRICMKIFRVWGKTEKCLQAYQNKGSYYWGGYRLQKR